MHNISENRIETFFARIGMLYSVQVYLINECETELYWIIGKIIDETTYDQLADII